MQLNFSQPAPKLVPHEWPFPGLTPIESAQSALSMSKEFADVIAATFFSQGGAMMTSKQVKAILPADWLEVLGRYAHASLTSNQAQVRGIEFKHVGHEGGGFHLEYRAIAI